LISSQPYLGPPIRRKNLRLVESALLALALATLIPRSNAQALPQPAPSQVDPAHSQIDSDQDGLSDALEQALLVQFAPRFLVGQGDCSNVPAEFRPGIPTPQVKSENGTIYGQVFPAKDVIDGASVVEIHYYHLWRIDCGRHGHPLDSEHVAILVRPSGPDLRVATWKALYWYAAAHENTACDVSQIARASTLHAEDTGPSIWISPGKHASYLNQSLCQKGCGADQCENMTPLAPAKLVNLGEPGHPMNGSLFIASTAWPLAVKMSETNFPAPVLARLSKLPDSDIAWFNEGRHPSQGVIAISSATEQAIAGSGSNTVAGISIAAKAADSSVSVANGSTGNALQKSYRHTVHALAASARHVGEFFVPKPRSGPPNSPPGTNPQ
jgi:hypothetical protein